MADHGPAWRSDGGTGALNRAVHDRGLTLARKGFG
jgi:hypothetical protein